MSDEGNIETVEDEIILGEILDTIRTSRSTIITRDGRITREKRTGLSIANCGHLVRSAEEIGGRCIEKDCRLIVCKNCARVCQRCMKLLCPKHQKLHQGIVFCSSCKLFVMFFGFMGADSHTTTQSRGNRTKALEDFPKKLARLLVGD